MREISTGVRCPHCKKRKRKTFIVALVESSIVEYTRQMIYGVDGSPQFTHTINSYYCTRCETIFRKPPGKPHIVYEIFWKLHKEEEKKMALDPALVSLLQTLGIRHDPPKQQKKLTFPKKK